MWCESTQWGKAGGRSVELEEVVTVRGGLSGQGLPSQPQRLRLRQLSPVPTPWLPVCWPGRPTVVGQVGAELGLLTTPLC